MKEKGNITEYLLRVDEIINAIRGIGGEIKEKYVVDKVLRTIPTRYDSKVSSLEERDDLKLMTIDELHEIFTSYEMITRKNGSSKKEAAFKVVSKIQSEDLDDEEALFIKKLERGTGKYKGKLPLKCFNYGRIGHFSRKCPYPKQEDRDDEEFCCHKKDKKNKTIYKKNFQKNKKNLYSKEDSEDDEMSEDVRVLFTGFENEIHEEEIEDVVDLET